jgi:hypothetical protein
LSGAGLDAASAPAPVGRPLLRTLLGGGEGEHARARSGTGGGPAAVRPEDRPIDLTAEDDTLTLPRLDSLERKLKDLEQQFN